MVRNTWCTVHTMLVLSSIAFLVLYAVKLHPAEIRPLRNCGRTAKNSNPMWLCSVNFYSSFVFQSLWISRNSILLLCLHLHASLVPQGAPQSHVCVPRRRGGGTYCEVDKKIYPSRFAQSGNFRPRVLISFILFCPDQCCKGLLRTALQKR